MESVSGKRLVICKTYHDSETLSTDIEREDLKGICDKHRRICNIIEQVK